MKWFGRFAAAAAAVLISSGGGSASTAPVANPADEAWATATKEDSLEAYAAFIMFYPDSPQAKSAYDRLGGIKTTSPKAAEALLEPEAPQAAPTVENEKGLMGFSSVAGKIWGIV